jgi:hypothetical protein
MELVLIPPGDQLLDSLFATSIRGNCPTLNHLPFPRLGKPPWEIFFSGFLEAFRRHSALTFFVLSLCTTCFASLCAVRFAIRSRRRAKRSAFRSRPDSDHFNVRIILL